MPPLYYNQPEHLDVRWTATSCRAVRRHGRFDAIRFYWIFNWREKKVLACVQLFFLFFLGCNTAAREEGEKKQTVCDIQTSADVKREQTRRGGDVSSVVGVSSQVGNILTSRLCLCECGGVEAGHDGGVMREHAVLFNIWAAFFFLKYPGGRYCNSCTASLLSAHIRSREFDRLLIYNSPLQHPSITTTPSKMQALPSSHSWVIQPTPPPTT